MEAELHETRFFKSAFLNLEKIETKILGVDNAKLRCLNRHF